jgi:hypothetical protein
VAPDKLPEGGSWRGGGPHKNISFYFRLLDGFLLFAVCSFGDGPGDLFDMLLPMLSIYQEYVRNHHYSLLVPHSTHRHPSLTLNDSAHQFSRVIFCVGEKHIQSLGPAQLHSVGLHSTIGHRKIDAPSLRVRPKLR